MALAAATVLVTSGAQGAPLRGAPALASGGGSSDAEACYGTDLSPEDGRRVLARGALMRQAARPEAPAAGPAPKSPFRLDGQKYPSRVGARSEAGVAMSLGAHVSIGLNYARTAQVPMMRFTDDNGILARLRFGF